AKDELETIRKKFSEKEYAVCILANIEFRIAQPNKSGEWINIHAIFSEDIPSEKINKVLSRIKLQNTTDDGKTIWCSKDSMDESGINFNEAIINYETLCEGLKNDFVIGRDFFIAICPNGYGGFHPEKKEGRSVAVAKEIDKLGDIVLGRPRDRDFFLSDTRYEDAPRKPVFVCSDAHDFNQIGSKYTWVKAKPSFQGLRQTLFEPAERVQQSDDFIDLSYVKPYFSQINLSGNIFEGNNLSFKEQTIPLNRNMVSIIGGRGTGKSIFLDAMKKVLMPDSFLTSERNVVAKGVSVFLDKGYGEESSILFNSENSSPYSYLHVSQGDIVNFAKNPESLSSEIKRMLGIREKQYDSANMSLLLDNLSKYRTFVDYWTQSDNYGNKINTDAFQTKIIEENQKLTETLTNPKNKELIVEYQKNSESINKLQLALSRNQELIAFIRRGFSEINERIKSYNELSVIVPELPLTDASVYYEILEKNARVINDDIEAVRLKNEEIKKSFLDQGINQDVSSLLSKLSEYQENIDKAKAKIKEIEENKKRYFAYVRERSDFAVKYSKYIEEQVTEIQSLYDSLHIENDSWNKEQNQIVRDILSDINIRGSIIFDNDKFYAGLEGCINRGKFRASNEKSTRQKLTDTFNVQSYTDFVKLLNNDKVISTDGDGELITIEDFFWKSEYFNQGGRYELMHYLFSPEKIKNYLYVNAEFTYKGKTVDQLSVGQRGTFYVSLKLATDPFGSPFVFDQPEDDLDNSFIMKQLVPLFKKIKKYRQVIIVTHNANLVINSDSEQVIVANYDGDVISYEVGAIEDGNIRMQQGIRHHICSILEGGHIAFSVREKKYGIQ
ncbi:DNA repair protein, partial [Salmonella enterica subsp. enterica]|nr:DNA repair protein [Salmonella enterica subsp. enterica]